jgi:hypothetical protein
MQKDRALTNSVTEMEMGRGEKTQQGANYSPSGWTRHSLNRGSTQSDCLNETKLKQKYFMYTHGKKS